MFTGTGSVMAVQTLGWFTTEKLVKNRFKFYYGICEGERDPRGNTLAGKASARDW